MKALFDKLRELCIAKDVIIITPTANTLQPTYTPLFLLHSEDERMGYTTLRVEKERIQNNSDFYISQFDINP